MRASQPKKLARKVPANGKRAPGGISGGISGEAPAKIEQPHGGALLAGGQPGHRGGPGRPRSEVRELALAGYAENLPRLIRIAAGTETRVAGVDKEGNVVCAQPTLRESREAMTELGNRGVGKMLEIDIPRTPVTLAYLVHPDVAAEREAQEAERQAKGEAE